MEDIPTVMIVFGTLFIGLPWLILHYVTSWRRARGLSVEDENLLDELHELARRLEDRLQTVERIVAAENPNWRQGERTERPLPSDARRTGGNA